jgi:hypothetical protein
MACSRPNKEQTEDRRLLCVRTVSHNNLFGPMCIRPWCKSRITTSLDVLGSAPAEWASFVWSCKEYNKFLRWNAQNVSVTGCLGTCTSSTEGLSCENE